MVVNCTNIWHKFIKLFKKYDMDENKRKFAFWDSKLLYFSYCCFGGVCQVTRLSSILQKDFSTMMFLWHYSPWRKCQMFCENPHPRFFCPALNCFGQMGGKKCSWQESCHRTEGEVASKGWKCVLQLWALWLHCGIEWYCSILVYWYCGIVLYW